MSQPDAQLAALLAVAAERARQVQDEGYDHHHDDAQGLTGLAIVANGLLLRALGTKDYNEARRRTIQAAATCLAAVEHLDRTGHTD